MYKISRSVQLSIVLLLTYCMIKAQPIPSSIDVANLNGSNGFNILFERENQGAFSTSNAGDINGDGIEDFIVSNPIERPDNFNANVGRAYVVFGSENGFPSVFDLADLNGANGFYINGFDEPFLLGTHVSGLGDVNGDNIDDIIVSATRFDENYFNAEAYGAYVIYGSTNFPQEVDPALLDGNSGFKISTIPVIAASPLVSAAGDINGDGLNDILLGDPFVVLSNTAKAYVLFGDTDFPPVKDLADLDGSDGFIFQGSLPFTGSGLAGGGDINNDGFDDIMIGAQNTTYVLYGKTTSYSSVIEPDDINGANGFIINEPNSLLGTHMSFLDDINGDNINDMILGAPLADPDGITDAGKAYVIFGKSGNFGPSFDLSGINGNNGFIIRGINAGDNLGSDVVNVGDFNGDGLTDIMIFADDVDEPPNSGVGASYVVFGSSSINSEVFSVADLDGSNGFSLNAGSGTGLNQVLASLDINNDGLSDVAAVENLFTSIVFGTNNSSPYFLELIIDLTVFENSNAITIDLTGKVTDDDSDDSLISFEVTNNTNPSVISTSIDNRILTIQSLPNQLGQSYITITATSGEFSVQNRFSVTVLESPLYEQTGTFNSQRTSSSQFFPDFNASLETADNFTIPIGETWFLDRVSVIGENRASAPSEAFFIIYADDEGSVGDVIFTSPDLSPEFTINQGSFTLTLPNSLELPQGTYWLSVQTKQAFNPGQNQWQWGYASPSIDGDYHIQDTDGLLQGQWPTSYRESGTNGALFFTLYGDVVGTSNSAPLISESTFSIDENSVVSTVVGTVTASDPEQDVLSYTIITGNDLGAFQIDEAIGEITVADNSPLDFETNPTFVLSVQVSDGTLNNQADITINLNDVAEAPLISGSTFSIDENSPTTTIIGTVIASDPEQDALTYTIIAGNELGAFQIDEATGEITVADANPLDFEINPTFVLTVQVSDGALNNQADITINLNDIAEPINTAPTVSEATFSIDENSPITTIIGTVTASDPEQDVLSYTIIAGNDMGAFQIDEATGEITVADDSPLDFEINPTFVLTVGVSDGALNNQAGITINLNDIAEPINTAPTVSEATFSIEENSPTTTVVGTVTASDPEQDALTYTIIAGNELGAFQIDEASGELTVADDNPLDFEINPTFVLKVQVSDGTLNNQADITINVNDVAEAPLITESTFSIDENSVVSTVVGTVTASDPEQDVLSYTIITGNELGAFQIDEAIGEITVTDANPLDFEINPTFLLTVQVSDGALNNQADITINLNDVAEAPLISESTFSIDENSPTTTIVGAVTASDSEQDALTYTIIAGNELGAFQLDEATGEITVTDANPLDFETNPSFVLTVQVSDGTLNNQADITINLNAVAEAPLISESTFSLDENSPTTSVVGTVIASDSEQDVLSYTIIAGNELGAFQIDEATGEITVADDSPLDFEINPAFVLTVQVSDGALNNQAGITINLNDIAEPINTAPTVSEATFSLDENSPTTTIVGTVTASDPEQDVLSYTIIAGNDLGAFQIDEATGEITVADANPLDFEINPTFVLTVQVSDGALNNQAGITINLNDVAEAPLISESTFSIDENSIVSTVLGTVTSSYPEQDALTYTIIAGNELGTFQIDEATGEITVTDANPLDFEINPTFVLTVQVSDGALNNQADITINLNDVAEAPLISESTFSIDENSPTTSVVGTVTASDPEEDVLTYTILDGNELGAFQLDEATGEITVADANPLDFEINPTFVLTVQVSDEALNNQSDITINLNDIAEPINIAPTVSEATFSIDENSQTTTIVGTVTASDPEQDVLSYTIITGNDLGAFQIDEAIGEITVADNSPLDFETNPTFVLTVQVSDGTLNNQADITINLNDVAEAPLILGSTFSIDEKSPTTTIIGTVIASDPEQDALTYTIIAGNELGAFQIDEATGEITVADANPLDFEINPTFVLTVQVSDGALNNQADITINLNDIAEPINTAPTVSEATFSIDENSPTTTVVGTVTASDPEQDVLSYTIIAGNDMGAFQIDEATGEITVADDSPLDFEINLTFVLIVQVSDGVLNNQADITINLNDIAEPINTAAPTVSEATFSIDENSPTTTVVGTVTASDPEQDALTYTIISGNELGAFQIDEATGEITVADDSPLDFEINPTFVLTVHVSDGALNNQADVTVNLNDVNEAIVFITDIFSLEENSVVSTAVGKVSVSDPDDNPIYFNISSGNNLEAFHINENTGEITVKDNSPLDFETNPAFQLTVSVSDGELSDNGTITINLININEPPVVSDRAFFIEENSSELTSVGAVSATDLDNDAVSFAIMSGNEEGAFQINESTGEIKVADANLLDFETNPAFQLTVEVSDTELTDTAIITINLTDLNEAPIVNNETFLIDENSPVSTNVGTISAFDPDSDPLSFTITSGNEHGAFQINQVTGEVLIVDTNVLDFETNLTFQLTVEVSDTELTDTAIITINLTDLNEAPIVNNETFLIDENSPVSTNVGTISAFDPDGDPLSFAITSGNEFGAFQVNETTGEITVIDTEPLDYETNPGFQLSYVVNDGELTNNVVVNINLVNVNEPPVVNSEIFSIDENSQVSTIVGVISASDPEGDLLTYTIGSGNELGAFEINETTGEITVVDLDPLDFEINQSFEVSIIVSDGELSTEVILEVILNDLNDNILHVNDGREAIIKVYPNPVRDYLFIDWQGYEKAIISNLSGKILLESNLDQISMKDLNTGVYLIILKGTNHDLISFRILKE